MELMLIQKSFFPAVPGCNNCRYKYI